ncbi:MAG: MTAP family purine nucleoside phosphorylase [Phycisphaerae bacterium]
MTSSNFSLACIGGGFAEKLLAEGKLIGTRLGARKTPFGVSQPVYLCEHSRGRYYLLLRHSDGTAPVPSSFANPRANIFTLKELGVTHIVSWSGARAVSHNYRIGQFVLADDLIDETHRMGTFFEHGAIMDLRQWPVFCPTLRSVLADTLSQLKLKYDETGTYLCSEGPRRETRAEVRKYALWGADLLGHSLAPEVFLARELQMCYAGICFIHDFAETGSIHRPYEAGNLFNNPALTDQSWRANETTDQMPMILETLFEFLPGVKSLCSCQNSLAELMDAGVLSRDFHEWFEMFQPAKTVSEEKKYPPLPVGLPGPLSNASKKGIATH